MKTWCGEDSHRGASPSLPHLMGVKWMMSNLGRGAWPKEDHLPVVTLANTGFISLKLNGSPWWETNEWRSWSYSHCANQEFYDKSIAITAATYLQSIALLSTLPKNIFVWPKVQNPKIKTHSDGKHSHYRNCMKLLNSHIYPKNCYYCYYCCYCNTPSQHDVLLLVSSITPSYSYNINYNVYNTNITYMELCFGHNILSVITSKLQWKHVSTI